MARGEQKNSKMAEYEEQLRRAEALLGEEKKPEPPAPEESPEEALRRAEETLARADRPPVTETAEEIRARVRREVLERTAESKEAAPESPSEKPGKLAPERKTELQSKIKAYEDMIAKEEREIERFANEMQLSAGTRSELGKHLPQMRETLRKMKNELRHDEGEEPGLTP